ncbi:MAG: BatA domain-containing protein [Pseudomonadota bacterium]
MNPALLFPLGLAALVALIVPLVVHLARKTEQRPTDFAALRWLRPKPRPRHRPRLDEWPLLIARLLLIALLASWLARPVLREGEAAVPVVAVVPGVDPGSVAEREGERRMWLAPDFPALSEPPPIGPIALASLVRELDATLPPGAKLTLVVPRRITGVDAERPRLSRAVEWRVVDGGMAAPRRAFAPLPLTIHAPTARAPVARYFQAAATAWAPPGKPGNVVLAAPGAALPPFSRTLIWLAPGALPASVNAWVERGGTALVATDSAAIWPGPTAVVWRDDVGAPLVEGGPLGRGRLLRFTRALAPAVLPDLLSPSFPYELRRVLVAPPVPTLADARDYAPTTGATPYPQPARELQGWLALLIAAALLAERWLATRSRRAIAP